MSSYKPLTPNLREEINNTINNQIAELKTCELNCYVNFQLVALNATKRLINALPDGYPIPMNRR